jgi:hypothetical protein
MFKKETQSRKAKRDLNSLFQVKTLVNQKKCVNGKSLCSAILDEGRTW